jgi:hypothetical protein
MSPAAIFNIHLALGYVPWLLCFRAYAWPKLQALDRPAAQRMIAALHSFRFFGLVFLLPGVVGPALPSRFAAFAAYGDFVTGLLAMLAFMTFRVRPLFWVFAAAFNVVGLIDLLGDYYLGVSLKLPQVSGALGGAYVIPIVYVPILMITHVAALRLALRPEIRGQELGLHPLGEAA